MELRIQSPLHGQFSCFPSSCRCDVALSTELDVSLITDPKACAKLGIRHEALDLNMDLRLDHLQECTRLHDDLKTCGFSELESMDLHRIICGLNHFHDLKFKKHPDGFAGIHSKSERKIEIIATFWGVEPKSVRSVHSWMHHMLFCHNKR